MTLRQASERYGITYGALLQAVKRGSLRTTRVQEARGITHYVTERDVVAYLNGRPDWAKERSGGVPA